MGGPSISILLNELAKLLKYADADAIWIRMGTCGGIDVAPGTLCISSESLNGALEPYHQTIVLGEKIRRPALFDKAVAEQMSVVCETLGLSSIVGKTMCCDDFYEGQGRLDGAICEYSLSDKMEYL
jgi:uridine phosphorylase